MKELSEIIQEMVDNGNSMGQMDLKTAIVFITEAYESGMEKELRIIEHDLLSVRLEFVNQLRIFLMIPSMPKCLRIALLPTEVR